MYDEEDRKLLFETKQKLDEATKLMGELMETIDVLSDPEMMKNIKQGQDDIKAGRVKDLRSLLKAEKLGARMKLSMVPVIDGLRSLPGVAMLG